SVANPHVCARLIEPRLRVHRAGVPDHEIERPLEARRRMPGISRSRVRTGGEGEGDDEKEHCRLDVSRPNSRLAAGDSAARSCLDHPANDLHASLTSYHGESKSDP